MVAIFAGGRKSIADPEVMITGTPLFMQPGDQGGGHFASSEMKVDEGYGATDHFSAFA
jgi:hypothetical protein